MGLNEKTIVVNEEDIKQNQEPTPKPTPDPTPEPELQEPGLFDPINEKYKEALGESVLDESSFTDLINSRSKAAEYESQLQSSQNELQSAMEYKAKWEKALETLDPEKLTPNQEVKAISDLSEKHKGVDIGIISKVRNTDLESMSNLDGLVLAAKIETKTNLPDSAIKGEILRKMGIEVESLDELTDVEKFRIESEFSSKKGVLEEIKAFQPEQSDFNLEAEITSYNEKKTQEHTALEGHNKEALNILFDGYKETKTILKDDKGNDVELPYVVDTGFKEQFFENALKNITDSGVKITTENAGRISSEIDQAFKTANFNKMMQDVYDQAVKKLKESTHNELHNDSVTNTTEAPIAGDKTVRPLRETLGAHMKQQ